jgi:polygalacturonase
LDGGVTNLEGFIILDNTSWMITVIDSESFTMNNVKAIAMLGNGDGLDLTSVSRASVKNSFIRATDDTFAIKSDPYFMRQTNRPTENVVIEDSVGWADGAGHAIAFMEQTTPYMRNIVFRNIDILHSYVDAVWFETGVNVYDVTLDDVRVEDMRGGYIFNIEGAINNLNVNNFSLLGYRNLARQPAPEDFYIGQ